MSHKQAALFGAAATIAIFAAQSAATQTAHGVAAATTVGPTIVGEVIVTAQKRQENIQNVGMSIQAASGDRLTKLGVTNTEQLQKIVPGFVFTPTYYGTNVYTIRGVGFQDTSLAGSPTVTVYLDEAPLPFSILTNGTTLDLQRVEVLKGPQGTLFGNNATGGAINYIANKPTDHFEAGGDVTYGRFSDVNVDGFVSGQIIPGLDARIAVQSHTSGAWQKGYGPQAGQEIGGSDFLNGRVSLLWKPNDRFKALLTVNGWLDKSYNQVGALYGIAELSPLSPLDPAIAHYPLAPHNDQAAGWNPCVNTSPFDPLTGQQNGAVYKSPVGVPESTGPGSAAWAGAQPTHCIAPRNDNKYYSGTLRMDYDFGGNLVLTSLTEYQRFDRSAGVDASGMPIVDYQSWQRGRITSIYQELRLAGDWGGKGSWLIGGNFEYDSTLDDFLEEALASSAGPVTFAYNSSYYNELFAGSPNSSCIFSADQPVGALFGCLLGPTVPINIQRTNTYAVFTNAEYPILPNLILQGGVRFTEEDKYGSVCANDSGDGSWALLAYSLQSVLGSTAPKLSPPGTCATVGLPQDNFNSPPGGFASNLNQNNVSWRAGLNYRLTPDNLLYVNVSKGYKGGSFPTVAFSTFTQSHPVVQEGLLAYEGGFKSSLFNRQLQINGAGFYYDYTDKQILGAITDVIFGALPALVNVPKSHVVGFELSGAYAPEWLRGLAVNASVSHQESRVDRSSRNVCSPAIVATLAGEGAPSCVAGDFYNYDVYSQLADFTGERFPSAPEWQATVDAEYDWKIRDDITAFVGLNVQYTSDTNTFFVNHSPIQPVGGYNLFGLPVTACANQACSATISSAYNHPNDPNAVAAYTLLDLRAGIQRGNWMFQVWGHNVTNAYYWTAAQHVNDVLLRYTGRPATYGVTLSFRYR